MIYIFWISIIIIFYHLVVYGILLTILGLIKRKKKINDISLVKLPTITVLCPAFNEEEVIEDKIKSFLDLDYPKNKIKMIVISDDSTDRTNEIVNSYTKLESNIELLIQKPRKGKQSGHNLVEPTIDTEYVLSTDANSIFDKQAVKELVKTMLSDEKVGMVIGQLNLISKNGDSGEGIYWKFENILKKLESSLFSIICANGSLFLIKRKLFTQIHPSSSDDFERTLIVLRSKYKAKFNNNAIVYEDVTEKPVEELGRKIRIIAQEWAVMVRNLQLLNPFKYFIISFFLISHKIIRWLLFFWSICIFCSNIFLMNNEFFRICLVLQILVIIIGLIELILEKNDLSIKLFKLSAYFLIMNYSSAMAIVKAIRGKQQATWDIIRK